MPTENPGDLHWESARSSTHLPWEVACLNRKIFIVDSRLNFTESIHKCGTIKQSITLRRFPVGN